MYFNTGKFGSSFHIYLFLTSLLVRGPQPLPLHMPTPFPIPYYLLRTHSWTQGKKRHPKNTRHMKRGLQQQHQNVWDVKTKLDSFLTCHFFPPLPQTIRSLPCQCDGQRSIITTITPPSHPR